MIKLVCIVEVHDAATEADAQAALDAFREAVNPRGEYGLSIYRAPEYADFSRDVRAILVDEDGVWREDLSGADVIEALSMALDAAGLGGEDRSLEDAEDDDDDRTCKRCGDVCQTLSSDNLCDGCVGEDADAAEDGERIDCGGCGESWNATESDAADPDAYCSRQCEREDTGDL